jgi:DnaK suppressor protein
MAPNDIRDKLARLRAELDERLTRIRRDRAHSDRPVDPDFAEQAVERENDDVLARLEVATAQDLAEVRHALERLDGGDYGRCETCGQPIDPARLKARPAAANCARCAAGQPAR